MNRAGPAPTDPATTLYLARHGQSEWNHRGLVTGRTDIGLSPKGLAQAQALAQCLEGERLDAIYTSALRRTADTARPTAEAKAMPTTPLAELDEIHLGQLEGRFRDERDPQAQAWWSAWQADPWGYRVPGGERFDEFAARVLAGLGRILDAHAGGAVLVVGHRATNRVVLGTLLGWPRERWPEIRLRNKFFYRVRLTQPPSIATITLGGSKSGRLVDGFEM